MLQTATSTHRLHMALNMTSLTTNRLRPTKSWSTTGSKLRRSFRYCCTSQTYCLRMIGMPVFRLTFYVSNVLFIHRTLGACPLTIPRRLVQCIIFNLCSFPFPQQFQGFPPESRHHFQKTRVHYRHLLFVLPSKMTMLRKVPRCHV